MLIKCIGSLAAKSASIQRLPDGAASSNIRTELPEVRQAFPLLEFLPRYNVGIRVLIDPSRNSWGRSIARSVNMGYASRRAEVS